MPGPPSGNGGGGNGTGGNSGNGGRSGGRGPRKPSGSKLLLDSLREACPAHKLKDLEELVKSLKGDEAKIREKISEWWDEPPVESEGDWEDVNKKSAALKNSFAPPKFHRGGRGGRDSGGRGRSRGGGDSARGYSGRGREGRGRGRFGERGAGYKPPSDKEGEGSTTATNTAPESVPETPVAPPSGVPMSGNTRAPQGAWAKRNETPIEPPVVVHEPQKPDTVVAPLDVPEIAPPPLPSPPVPTVAPVTVAAAAASTPSGNVWALRGSAHLIQAEKPPAPQPAPAPAPISRKSNGTSSRKNGGDRAPRDETMRSSNVESVGTLSAITRTHDIAPVLPVEVVMAPPQPTPVPQIPQAPPQPAPGLTAPPMSWSHQEKPVETVPQHQQQQSVPVVPPMGVSERPKVEVTPSTSVTTNTTATTTVNVLNMGRWETADADDSLDFGFGSFGNDKNDVVDTNENNTASAASPARPPPGLSITGMPPMPTNAVLVHELENKLEDVSVSKQHHHPHQQVPDNHQSSGIGSLAPASHQLAQNIHHPHISMHDNHISPQQQQPPVYGGNQYGSGAGMGMYGNYNVGGANAGHTFMNMPGAGAGPGIGQPHQGPHAKGPTLPPQQQQPPQPNLYNQAPSSGNAPVVGTPAGVAGNDAAGGPNSNNASGMPPGMPGMPYGNPMYYGQQQFHMAHNQPGIGYNYGYGGQFGGGVQGGFGYPGGMHGNAGYGHGGPQYDDHSGTGAGPAAHGPPGSGGGGVGGYNPQNPQQQQQGQQSKNNSGNAGGGGYRGGGGGGRHNNNNQYQQYNPQPQHHQHAGYGGPPYAMGYGDHFNQRGGYQNMQDPYGMPQQPQQGVGNYGGNSFQGDNQYKGKKNNRGGLNQFQQQGPPNQHLPAQQPFGLHGQGGAETNQQSSDGWSNQGGWSGGGGSGGGSSGWQGAK